LSNPDDTSVKAMDELQDVCLKYIKITWSKGQLTPLLRNNEHRSKFDNSFRLLFCV
jgi:hypothetical protein